MLAGENSILMYDYAIILKVIIIILPQITADFRKAIKIRSFAKNYLLNKFYVAKILVTGTLSLLCYQQTYMK